MINIDLSPQIVNLTLYAGDGVTFRLTVIDKNEEIVPLTGEMIAEIRSNRSDTDSPKAQFSINLDEAENGIAYLSLTGDQTRLLAPSPPEKKFKGVWDLQWTPIDKQPRTLCQGEVVCFNDVSR